MLKDYFYISDRKVDSYSAQIPPCMSSRLSGEVTANLGVVSAKLSQLPQAQNRVSRMMLVKEYIEKQYELGTVDLPGSWVKDTLTVRHVCLQNSPNVFLLIGKTHDGDICALAGASEHVVGRENGQNIGVGASFFPDLAHLIQTDLRALDRRDAEIELTGGYTLRGGIRSEEVSDVLMELLRQSNGPTFNVEFLGRYVFEERDREQRTYRIFTPLYVELISDLV